MARMSGYFREELLGATPRLQRGAETDREMLDRLRLALKAGEYFEVSTVNYRSDGTPYPVEWHISPVRNETGVITHFVSVQHDITRAFEDLKQIRLLSSALEMSSDSVFITDASGNIEYVNRAFEHYTGYDRHRVIGQNPRVLKSGQHSPQFYRNMWETLIRGEIFRDTFIDQGRDGQSLYMEQTITPIKGEQGDIIRYVAVGKDITRRV
ncbi:PAS domain S-box protein [Halomonas alkaliantarctica]|nr:PAS domain S-box protein [Halomonas alkaliantarctica]